MIKRLDRVDVATSDLADAASIYSGNFGFKVTRNPDGSASVKVGSSEIRLVSGAPAADALKTSGEGMFGLWLETDDLDGARETLRNAGFASSPIQEESGRRVIAIDPKAANQVPLFLFDRKP